MSSSITDMQLFFMGLHETDHTFSCKNTDQLSSLWAAFTKCKRNIRDGFRLENMSWRLWSRQAVLMRKRLALEAAIVIPEFTTTVAAQQESASTSITLDDDYTKMTTLSNNSEYTAPPSRLVRTRSLPSFTCQAQHIMDSCQTPTSPLLSTSSLSLSTMDFTQTWSSATTTVDDDDDMIKECSVPMMTSSSSSIPKRSKFYIDQEDDGDDDNEDNSIGNSEESDVESMYNHDDGDYFDDMDLSCYSSDTTSSSPSLDSKPVSLLTNLLQQNKDTTELRRSNCCERLDLWFKSGALSST